MSIYSTNSYYVYQYLRTDGTPYYIGKGKGNRAWSKGKHEIKKPSDENRIILLRENLDEETAFKLESELIQLYGRKSNGTGILRNMTDGGEGISGHVHNNETRLKMSTNRRGKPAPNGPTKHSQETKNKISNAISGEKNPMYGKKHLNGSIAIMSAKKQGKNNPMYGYEFPIVVCPHCGQEGKNMRRWHFDNCKQKGA